MLSITSVVVNSAAVVITALAIPNCNFDWGEDVCNTTTIITIVIECCLVAEYFCLLITILVSSQGFCCGNVIRSKIQSECSCE